MKIRSKNNSKKRRIILLTMLIVVLAGGGAVAAYVYREELGIVAPTTDGDEYDAPSNQEIEGESTVDQTEPLPNQTPDPHQNPDGTPPSSDQSNSSSPYTVTVTSINQNDSTLQIRATVSPLTNAGNCTLSLSKVGESPVRRTVGVQAMSSYASCMGFDIDTTNLSPGSWTATVTYEEAGETSTARGTAVVR